MLKLSVHKSYCIQLLKKYEDIESDIDHYKTINNESNLSQKKLYNKKQEIYDDLSYLHQKIKTQKKDINSFIEKINKNDYGGIKIMTFICISEEYILKIFDNNYNNNYLCIENIKTRWNTLTNQVSRHVNEQNKRTDGIFWQKVFTVNLFIT